MSCVVYEEAIQHHLYICGFPEGVGMESQMPIDSDTYYLADSRICWRFQVVEAEVTLGIYRLHRRGQKVLPVHLLEELLS